MNFQPSQLHPRNPVSGSRQTFYFAYGSNLSFDQMAKRCPESRFVGRARLYNHAFQINQRGFANIINTNDPPEFVDGLCYLISTNDEIALDRSEGVPYAYQKEELEVEFFPAASDIVGRDVVDIVRSRMQLGLLAGPTIPDIRTEQKSTLQPNSATAFTRCSNNLQALSRPIPAGLEYVTDFNQQGVSKVRRTSSMSSLQARAVANKGAMTKAMVYLSRTYVDAGQPWDEYIERVGRGLKEALQQGISTAYAIEITQRWLRIGNGVRTAMSGQSLPEKRRMNARTEGAEPLEPPSARIRRSRRDSTVARHKSEQADSSMLT